MQKFKDIPASEKNNWSLKKIKSVGHYIFVVNLANKNFHNHKLLFLPACSLKSVKLVTKRMLYFDRSLSCFWPVLNQFTYTWVSRRLDSTFSDIIIRYPSVGLLVRSSRWPITLYLKRLKTDIAAVYPAFFSFFEGEKTWVDWGRLIAPNDLSDRKLVRGLRKMNFWR